MTNALNVVSEPQSIASGVRKPEAIAEGLANVLADTYMLVFKTHAYHWNVEGPLFYSLHIMTEAQYEDMFGAADELAERIRAIGQLAPMGMGEICERSVVVDSKEKLTAGEMCEALVADHERTAHRFHALVKLAGELNDPVTEDLATARSAFHEQSAWMLKALIAK